MVEFVDYYADMVEYYKPGAEDDYYADIEPYYTPDATAIDLALGNKQPIDMNFEMVVQPGGFIDLNKHVQTFVGDDTNAEITLDSAAWLKSIEVKILTKGPIPNVIEWIYEHHWTATLDSDGWVTAVSLVDPIRWPANAVVHIYYNTKPV